MITLLRRRALKAHAFRSGAPDRRRPHGNWSRGEPVARRTTRWMSGCPMPAQHLLDGIGQSQPVQIASERHRFPPAPIEAGVASSGIEVRGFSTTACIRHLTEGLRRWPSCNPKRVSCPYRDPCAVATARACGNGGQRRGIATEGWPCGVLRHCTGCASTGCVARALRRERRSR